MPLVIYEHKIRFAYLDKQVHFFTFVVIKNYTLHIIYFVNNSFPA